MKHIIYFLFLSTLFEIFFLSGMKDNKNVIVINRLRLPKDNKLTTKTEEISL